MATEIRVPNLGESITEATIGKWFKQVGEAVAMDEPLVELETDKVTLEVPAPSAGALVEITAQEGDTVEVGALLGAIDTDAKGAVAAPKPAPEPEAAPEPETAPAPEPTAAAAPLSPAVRKLIDEHGLDPAVIPATGKDGRLLKGGVLAWLEKGAPQQAAPVAQAAPAAQTTPAAQAAPASAPGAPTPPKPRPRADREERVRMSRLRQRIAERLKEAQNTAAMLTTFNEVDMSELMATRSQYKELFEKKHNARLGFMSFFVKAAVMALKDLPAVNAEIDGNEIVYKNYYDIGVAVSAPQGLVVPVVRDADEMSFAEIELKIADYGRRARDGKIALEELQGGTFTISNGGVFGSLMSTPILNPPQSAILGMHKIQPRPMAIDGEVQIRPMMYLALSYDHRIVDGREAVTFLVRMKECLEDPHRMMLDL
jgi:2-oxoglutarate dehydrogenase E2 component (dihydrolipoamide succinyltransferase)